jgi:hypothetical protein
MSRQQKNIAGKKFLSQQAEDDTDDQYNPPEEIDIGVQNSNLLLTSDHEYTVLGKEVDINSSPPPNKILHNGDLQADGPACESVCAGAHTCKPVCASASARDPGMYDPYVPPDDKGKRIFLDRKLLRKALVPDSLVPKLHIWSENMESILVVKQA